MNALRCLALVPPGLLEFFDAHRGVCWTIAWLAWLTVVALAVVQLAREWHPDARSLRHVPRGLLSPGVFLAAATVAMILFRWPLVMAGRMTNPDEPQLAAAAMTYWRDPVPWRSVDLHTSGPLNAYFLWPALWLRGHIGYAELRATALLAHVITVLAVFGALRRLLGEGLARITTLPLLSFVAFATLWEFVQYSSEQLSVMLIAIAAWLLASACVAAGNGQRRHQITLFLGGAALGAVPFAKLQGTLLAGLIGMFALTAVIRVRIEKKARIRGLVALVAGAATPALIMGVILTIYGLWAQFHAAYIESNSSYVDGFEEGRMHMLEGFFSTFVAYNPAFKPFFCGTLLVALAVALGAGVSRVQPRALLAAAWILTAAAFWSVIYPGRPFSHYLHFLLPTLAWLGGISLAAWLRSADQTFPVRRIATVRWASIALFAALLLAPAVAAWLEEDFPVPSLVAAHRDAMHPVSKRVRELARPGDTLVVWGWYPWLYPETGLNQGLRDAHTYNQIAARPMQRFYRDRAMRDLRKNQPAFVVDAVAPSSFVFTDRATAGMAIFPEFAAYVNEHYRFVEEIRGFRIYERNDRK